MIKHLRIRFIAASMLALTIVLLVILGGINLTSYYRTVQEADAILAVLSENGGQFPQRTDIPPEQKMNIRKGMPADRGAFGTRGFSPETPFESRFFRVELNAAAEVTDVDIQKTASVDRETAAQCAEHVFALGREQGFWGDYRYSMVSQEDGGVHIIFLDCSRSLAHFRTTLLASIAVALGGLAAVLALLILLSGRIVRPIAESHEKQKRFITDAGHEIKTPLTVIGADLDLAEMDGEDNEWLQDIRLQIQRLTDLTNDLILLSRMDEQPMQQAVEFPISDIVEETAQSFQGVAACQGKTFSAGIQPMLSMEGVEKDIRKLISILLDNAVKYAAPGGNIALRLERKGRNILLTVSNTIREPMPEQQLSQLFDRFYRADPARSTNGGYGLGLSIAKGVVQAHRGTIHASADSDTLTITASMPTK